MKISKKVIATMMALGVAGVGVLAYAAPPVGKTVLQTYSCKRVNDCYTGIGTGKTGWIAAHDDLIRLYEIRSDGWVKGDYPAGSGRVTRWFRFGDLVMNGNFQNYEANLVNVKTAPVYRTHNSGSSFGTVYNTDKVIVVDEYGSRKCIVYNLDAGGYKMGWVDGNKVARVNNPISLQPAAPAVGWYYLESVWKPGYVIAVNSNNNNVCVQKQTDASMQANMDRRGIKSNQKWYLSRNGNSYLLRNEANNLYMNLSGSGFSNERNINAVAMANSRSLFNFFTYGGYYFLQPNGGGNYVLDLYGGNNMAYRDNIQIYGASGGVNQAWKLVKVTTPSPQPQPKPQPVNLQDVVAQRMKSGVLSYHPQGQYWPDGECRGFATTVFDEIFENDTGAHMLRTSWRYKYSEDNMGFGVAESVLNSCGIKTVGRVSETGLPPLGGKRYPSQVNQIYTSGFRNNLKTLFQRAKVGDFVQMARRKSGNSVNYCGLPHSAIIQSMDSNGVRFFESNVTPVNAKRVSSGYYTWEQLADKNIGFTIYEPINYK